MSLYLIYFINGLVKAGFNGGSDGKESASSAGDLGLIPKLGRSPGEGNDNPLQYYCLENPLDRGAWSTTVHGVAESDTTEQLTLLFFFKALFLLTFKFSLYYIFHVRPNPELHFYSAFFLSVLLKRKGS